MFQLKKMAGIICTYNNENKDDENKTKKKTKVKVELDLWIIFFLLIVVGRLKKKKKEWSNLFLAILYRLFFLSLFVFDYHYPSVHTMAILIFGKKEATTNFGICFIYIYYHHHHLPAIIIIKGSTLLPIYRSWHRNRKQTHNYEQKKIDIWKPVFKFIVIIISKWKMKNKKQKCNRL